MNWGVNVFLVRKLLGSLILFFDWLFSPSGVQRNIKEQDKINRQTAKLSLYQYAACPFCVKVRRAMKRNSLFINVRDAKRCESSRKELIEKGGKLKVPCLRIEKAAGEVQWMYESSDIIHYLETRFKS